MKIFIGSSRESLEVVDWVSMILQEYGHEPVRWDSPGLFPPGDSTFYRLVEISQTVDGAIFVFAQDDKIWYRGDAAHQPRDNVLIEYGLFAGRLSPRKAIIGIHESPKQASDLRGITYIDFSTARRERARVELRIWANNLQADRVDPATLQLMAKIAEHEKKVGTLEQKLSFEREKAIEFEELLAQRGIIDLGRIDLSSDGHWKLLFRFEYFWDVSQQLARHFATPAALRMVLEEKGFRAVAREIDWAYENQSAARTVFLTRKVLRLFRRDFRLKSYCDFVNILDLPVKESIERIAKDVLTKQRISSTD